MNNGKDNKQLDCDIVRDLLPLYHDGVVSEVTEEAVREHLDGCQSCRSEYEAMCAELPVEETDASTKGRFISMIQRQRRKRWFITVVSVLAACVLFIAAYFAQRELGISHVPNDEITVYSAYRFETDEGYKFFVLYSMPHYDYASSSVSVKKGETGDVLVMSFKKPLLSKKHPELEGYDLQAWIYSFGYSTSDGDELDYTDFSAVEFAGKIIWSQEANGSDEVPDYVYAFDEFGRGEVVTWITSEEDGYLGARYADGRLVMWDFDGNVLYEGYQNN